MCLMHTLFSARLVNLCCLWLFYYYCCCCFCCCFRLPFSGYRLVMSPSLMYKRPQHSTAHSFRTAAAHFVAQVRVIGDMGKNGTMYSIERNKIRKKTATKTTMTTNHTLTMKFNSGNSTIMFHTLAEWLADWLVANKKSSAFVYSKSKIPLFVFVSVRFRSSWVLCFFGWGTRIGIAQIAHWQNMINSEHEKQ